MTSGGSSSAQSTPASQKILGNGSRSRAIIQRQRRAAADQQRPASRRRTRTDVSQRVQVPGPGQRPTRCRRGDIRVMSVITGPSSGEPR